MKASVFDERRNVLGEGPTASGPTNETIKWVDLYGKKVRGRHLTSGAVSEYETTEDVGFAIPRTSGGEIIGTANGPQLRDPDGTLHSLPTRIDVDGYTSKQIVRWNDAKVSPQGDLFLGSMAYDFKTNAGAFYQMRADGKHMRRLFGDVTISNGLDWTVDGKTMFYIDTPLLRVDIFDVEEREIRNRRTLVEFPESMGMPDGMSADADGNLWVAFWMGHAVRCFDGKTGALLEQISCPAPRITSCVFGGENLDQLIITSASEDTDLKEYPEAGFVYIATPGVRGQKTNLFGA
ncbi:MAG: SMP-30/gluconolactonase/LRE family protein [Actinobacteria bacterium]|nr:SMP-30/gluconolactonase/LRE family protein [Actinomycetota bacterium]